MNLRRHSLYSLLLITSLFTQYVAAEPAQVSQPAESHPDVSVFVHVCAEKEIQGRLPKLESDLNDHFSLIREGFVVEVVSGAEHAKTCSIDLHQEPERYRVDIRSPKKPTRHIRIRLDLHAASGSSKLYALYNGGPIAYEEEIQLPTVESMPPLTDRIEAVITRLMQSPERRLLPIPWKLWQTDMLPMSLPRWYLPAQKRFFVPRSRTFGGGVLAGGTVDPSSGQLGNWFFTYAEASPFDDCRADGKFCIRPALQGGFLMSNPNRSLSNLAGVVMAQVQIFPSRLPVGVLAIAGAGVGASRYSDESPRLPEQNTVGIFPIGMGVIIRPVDLLDITFNTIALFATGQPLSLAFAGGVTWHMPSKR